MTDAEHKEFIKSEYYRAEIYCKAMQALIKSEGISLDGVSESPKQEETAQEQKPQENAKQDIPQTTEPTAPGIVYDGKTEYTISPNERVKFSVYFNGVTSSSDYRIMPSGNPQFINPVITGNKTSAGYRVDFDVTGAHIGQGSLKMYIKAEPDKVLNIIINVK